KIPVEWPEDALFLEPKEGMPVFKRRRSGPPARRREGGDRRSASSNGRRPRRDGGQSRSRGPKSFSKSGSSGSGPNRPRRRPSGQGRRTPSGNK
ncbi:MAG: hypothetical protein IH886_15910, partial [Nitrospinae bacterium]|nr:hypothetical protein [Nitrospinota bacterium]